MAIDISKAIDDILEAAEQHRYSLYKLPKDKRVRFKAKKAIDKLISEVRRQNDNTGVNNALLPDVTNCPLCGDDRYDAKNQSCLNLNCDNSFI